MRSDSICKGAWELGTACKKCSKCKEFEAKFLRGLLDQARNTLQGLVQKHKALPSEPFVWRLLVEAHEFLENLKKV